MGSVASYYIIYDSIIDEIEKKDIDFEKYLEKELMFHEYQGLPFTRQGVEFGEGVKAWSPMYELLTYLDRSTDNKLNRIKGKELQRRPTKNNEGLSLYRYVEVEEIWQELKDISVGDMEKAFYNTEAISKIEDSMGSNQLSIKLKEKIVIEFVELYVAFFKAKSQKAGIVVTYG